MTDRAQPAQPPPFGLPAEISRLVGRKRELSEIKRLLETTRLLTLVGTGGCGKTRLALRVAHEMEEHFEDGVRWVDLAPVTNASGVAQAVAAALDVRERPRTPVVARVVEHLKPRASLLVLDNCEHLLDTCARLAIELLRACPRLRVLATSREGFAVPEEMCWLTPPLALPELDQRPRVDELHGYAAVKLFIDRAKAVQPSFEPNDDNAEAVLQVCRALDGLPLATELAAARMRLLSVAEIASRLTDALGLLTARSRTARPHHRTLRATIDWSHGLLSVQQKKLFRRLSVFHGGFALAAAEAVCAGDGIDTTEILDLLAELVSKSMVFVETGSGEARYKLLEVILQYARERLLESGEVLELKRRHANFHLSLVEQLHAGMSGTQQWGLLRRLQKEHANLTASLTLFQEYEDVERGLRLAGALLHLWWFRGYFTEGKKWIADFLAMPGAAASTTARAQALRALGVLTYRSGGDSISDREAGRSELKESATIYRHLGDHTATAATLRDLARAYVEYGDWAEVRVCLDESLCLDRRTNDPIGIALALTIKGIAGVCRDDQVAAAHFEAALETLRESGSKNDVATCQLFLGCLACDRGDASAARAYFAQIVAGSSLQEYRWPIPYVLLSYARLAALEGKARSALTLGGAAESLREDIGVSAGAAYQAYFLRGLDPAWRKLGEAQGRTAFEAGRRLGLQQAVEEAERVQRASNGRQTPAPGGLSARELGVLRLVARGLTDRQVAEQLGISSRTVGQHLRSIYRKLDVSTRTAAAREAIVRGAIEPADASPG